MYRIDKWKYETLVKTIASFDKGGKGAVIPLGLPQIIIQEMRHILNTYSCLPCSFLYEFIATLLQTHAPQKSLLRFERFLDMTVVSLDVSSITPKVQYILARIFAASGALAGRLSAHPSIIGLLEKLETPLMPQLDKDYYTNSILEFSRKSDIVSKKIQAVHCIQSVQLMRICARNSNHENNIAEINCELTSLAEAVLESCLAIAYDELISRIGIEPKPHSLAVLGLGKLGGMELNVSSDIDVIYLCSDKEETWGQYDSIHFHTILAERLTRILSEFTELGIFYRVDTRLRADGASGPLVRSTWDYFRYLEMRGEAWERQMLLKARSVAGNHRIGRKFLESICSFIYPASIMRSPNREIVDLKNRIEARITAEGSKKTHLKLAQGGIRDIEFVVQCLQLLMGGIHPEVRCSGTLPALDRLNDFRAINNDEYQVLTKAYTFYRRIENALQWRELLPAFNLPDTQEEMNELASYLNFAAEEQNPSSSLLEELDRNLKAVRAIYNEVFNVKSTFSFEEMLIHVAFHPSGNEKVKRFMESLGFHNPLESARTLSRLIFEKSKEIPNLDLHPSIGRFIPKLLSALSELPDPGGALERLTRVMESYQARFTLFDVLDANPSFFEVLLSITHSSIFITDILVRDPYLIDWLVEVGEILHSINTKEIQRELNLISTADEADELFTQACATLKNRETLRIGVRDITGLTKTSKTFMELSKIAECIAGRLGAGMMDFGSDLDLIFIYREPSKKYTGFDATSFSIKLAQYILSLITGSIAGKIYDVDARLRPEGGSSVLAVSLEEYKRYLDNRASEWERLALIRARPIAGSTNLGSEVNEIIHNFCYRKPFTGNEVKRIMEIRAIMIESSAKRHPRLINVKSGAGGLADIDYIAQSYAACYGASNRSLRYRETHRILEALGSASILERHDVSTLTELYSFLCGVEKALRIGSGRAVNTLPESEAELARIAQFQGFNKLGRFRKRLADVTSLTRELYDRLMNELLNRAENGENRA